MAAHRNTQSLETIMTYENKDLSQWSVIWSASQVPVMDTGTGAARSRLRTSGRRRLRMGTLALGSLLTMHCRVTASALTGGIFLYVMFLIAAVVVLASPLRHFEVYLGQWSISGPGRSFRIIPLLDGIGIAMCINAIVRAIYCCTVAAIAALYVAHAISDSRLPFTYCRDFDLKSYEPIMKDLRSVKLQKSRFSLASGKFYSDHEEIIETNTVGMIPGAWRNFSNSITMKKNINVRKSGTPHLIGVCNENYSGNYPALYSTPAYNYFYVEVVQLRQNIYWGRLNLPLVISNVIIWVVLWGFMVTEKIRHGKLRWNNIYTWIVAIPWIWAVVLSLTSISSFWTMKKSLKRVFRIGTKEFYAGIIDALEVALYIHSVSVGTELIHGKGLNHYASGHVDPELHCEVVWQSALLLIVTALHLVGTAICAIVDCIQPSVGNNYNMRESTLWVLPMYSKCASLGNYTHIMTTLIFGGLMFSYMTVAFLLLKTALHIIFEYRVKLVFLEQIVVGVLIMSCMGLNLVFANGGVALIESVDSLMTGVAVPYVCVLELVCLLYVYRSHDFVSDMNVSTEDSACSSRLSYQWQMIPFIALGTLVGKSYLLVSSEMPKKTMLWALAPLVCVILAVPFRALHNAYVFLKSHPRRGT